MLFSRRFLAVTTVVLVLLLLGGGVYLRLREAPDGDGAGADTAAGEARAVSAADRFATDIAIPVEGAPVRRDTLVIAVTAAGQAAAFRRTVLTARVPGRITGLPVRENRAVEEGRLLLALDTTEYALAAARARSELLKAEAEYRQLTLFDEEIADTALKEERERFARARSGLDQARVALEEAEIALSRTRVRAPFPGRVADLGVVPGEWVEKGAELMTVVDPDPLKVEVQVLETEVAFLEEGRGATVTFAAFPGEEFRGRIETINPVVDPERSVARVTVVIPNPRGRILPGMSARISLDARRYPDRILVPKEAILERDRRTMLFVFDGGEGGTGRSEWRYVTTGLENDSLVAIVENPETRMVEPGEIVLVDGHYSLIHDARVRLVEDVQEAGGRPR